MENEEMSDVQEFVEYQVGQFKAKLPEYGTESRDVLYALQQQVWSNCEAKGHNVDANTMAEYVALLHSEVSEMLEAWRDHHDTQSHYKVTQVYDTGGYAVKPIGVDSEMADVFIRLLHMCEVFGVDLLQAFTEKMAYNRTRPYQHGGRALRGGNPS
jgi:NTP pyrophosphatase (non-canonical NTP hydrolase)